MLEQYVQELIGELNLDSPLSKDQDAFYTLPITTSAIVRLKKLDPGFFFTAEIGKTPEQKKEDFFEYLLRANYLSQGTQEARIGMSLDEKFLTLSITLPYEMNYKDFKESLETFVNTLYYWQEELKRHNTNV